MAVVSYVAKEDAAEKIRPILENMATKAGVVPHIYAAMAHSPELFEGFLALSGALAKTKLDGKLRELAYIKASELNGCDYCLHYHRGFGRKAGLTERQTLETAQVETSDAYDEHQRDVLRYAEEVTRHIKASDALIERLRQRLSDREIVELAMTVGIANFTNRVTETLRMELP
ncbi:MAG: carboxymuconolactone decarboxylase family protein [Isosphaeraceae bacterium]|nr:carboxymuconolactone decarboxylase family protein [Isosphaeraceae bacterium]